MKKGFTLVELLAVIIILAVISTIVVPIVLNIVNDSKKSTYQSSIELYGKAVKQAILNYELDKKVTPTTFTQIKPYLEFEGNNVECNTKIIYEDGEIYLKDCSVDGNPVEGYTYGKRTLGDTILKHATDNNYYYKTKPDFTKATEDGEFGLYVAKDDLGDSYYFRGDVENNYVEFSTLNKAQKLYAGGFYNTEEIDSLYSTMELCEAQIQEGAIHQICKEVKITTENHPLLWRIIRINGDGTIRLMYYGTRSFYNEFIIRTYSPLHAISSDIEGITTWDVSKKTVGYMYGTNEEPYENLYDSQKKMLLDQWYKDNLKNKYDKYISDSIFCNDREEETSIDPQADGYGFYKILTRIKNNSYKLTCTNQNDRFTVENEIGNTDLIYPIGLITADEFFMSGGALNQHYATMESLLQPNEYMKYSGQWTMTPYDYGCEWPGTTVLISNKNELLSTGNFFTNESYSLFPVINLKADVRFTGTGTIDDPYVIMTD